MGYRPPVPQEELGPRLVKEYGIQSLHHLLDVPSIRRV